MQGETGGQKEAEIENIAFYRHEGSLRQPDWVATPRVFKPEALILETL